MPSAPTTAPRMLGWATSALQRSSNRFDRIAQQLAVRTGGISPTTAQVAARTVNTAVFERATAEALLAATSDRPVSIIAASIDYFDVLNASHGTDVGREVHSAVAARLRDAIRGNDFVTDFGTTGFAVLWAPDSTEPDATEVARRIAGRFDRPIITSIGQLPVTVSTGVATAQFDGSQTVSQADVHTLQRHAQTAVLSAQRNGRAQFAIFDRAIEDQAIESYKTEHHLRTALRNDGLSVDYQPVVNLQTGEIVGVEALARWRDESLGFVSPGTFIPIAEESGLIGEVGRVVLESAVAQGSAWNADASNEPTGSSNRHRRLLTVNLSNRQLLDQDLIPSIAALLDEHDLSPSDLCMEITESVVMSDVAASTTILGQMKDLGLVLAIDDFGTGYSSLSYLRRLPVDILKIDRSFVQSVYNRDDRVIAKAIIDLAHTLGMTTVAEGVETRLQVEVLHALNCDMAQGFLLHPPTPPEQVDFSPISFENYAEEIEYGSLRLSGSRDSLSAPASSIAPSVLQ